MRLVYAIDVSGNLESGNHKYMGIIVCTGEFHDAIVRNLGLDTIPPNKHRIREDVLSRVQFRGRECLALCVRIEQNNVLKKMYRAVPGTKNLGVQRNLSIRKNIRAYHGTVWYLIRDPIMDFLHRYRQGFEDIVFEADGDCADFLANVGLRHTAPLHAHRFADAIACAQVRRCHCMRTGSPMPSRGPTTETWNQVG